MTAIVYSGWKVTDQFDHNSQPTISIYSHYNIPITCEYCYLNIVYTLHTPAHCSSTVTLFPLLKSYILISQIWGTICLMPLHKAKKGNSFDNIQGGKPSGNI